MKKNNTLGAGGWMLGLVLSLLFSMVLGVALIWLSIDRNAPTPSTNCNRGWRKHEATSTSLK